MKELFINRIGVEYKLINLEHNNYRYYISKCAKVWDIDRDIEVPQVLTGKPQYKYVNMTLKDHPKGRVLRRVHNLNLRTYVELPDEDIKYYADHIDRDKFNNHLGNLRWVTRRGNALNQERSLNRRITLSEVKYHFPDLADEVTKLNGHDRARNLGRLDKLPKDIDYIDFELLELCCEEIIKPKPYVYKDKELFDKSENHLDYLKMLEDKKEFEIFRDKYEGLERKLKESDIEYKGEKYLSLVELYKDMVRTSNQNFVGRHSFILKVKNGLSYEKAIVPINPKRGEVKDGKTLRELHEESGVEWDFYLTETRYHAMSTPNRKSSITWDNIFVTKPRIKNYNYKGVKYKKLELCSMFSLNKGDIGKKVNFDYPLGQYMLDRGIPEGEFVIPIY